MAEKVLACSEIYSDSILHSGDLSFSNAYYGFNVTKSEKEPIDQIQAFLAAKRVSQECKEKYGKDISFFPFIAGAFEVLHKKNADEMYATLFEKEQKENSKRVVFNRILDRFGLEGKTIVTRDLWQDPSYWDQLKYLFENNFFTKEGLIDDVSLFVYKDKSRKELESILSNKIKVKDVPQDILGVDSSLLKMIGDWPADIIYTPAEVAEALYFKKNMGVGLKIGPSKERAYDKYISLFMDVLHLKQPTAMNSQRLAPITVTPYIDKKSDKVRIFFGDSSGEIAERIKDISPEEYIWTIDDTCGSILNPFVEKTIYCVESARAMDKVPLVIDSRPMFCGSDVVNYLNRGGSVKKLKNVLPAIAEEYLTRAFI